MDSGVDPSKGREEETDEPPMVTLARFSGFGMTLALATAVFLFLGRWADGKLGTAPWLTLLGAMVGAAGGFYHILQHLVFFPQEEERRKLAESAGSDAKSGEKDRHL